MFRQGIQAVVTDIKKIKEIIVRKRIIFFDELLIQTRDLLIYERAKHDIYISIYFQKSYQSY